jgi:hypothetical protein
LANVVDRTIDLLNQHSDKTQGMVIQVVSGAQHAIRWSFLRKDELGMVANAGLFENIMSMGV